MMNVTLSLLYKRSRFISFAAAVLCADGALAQATFDGRSLDVQTCRVSAIPYNRVWPGYQRSLDQTKTAFFVSFDLERPGEFTWRLPAGAEGVRVRPFARAQGTVEKGVFRTRIERPEDFVIETSETEYHVFARPPWHYEPRKGDRYFGPGTHEAGCILPKSGERIVLDRGAIVYGNFVLLGVTNVTIEGRGILDTSRIAREDPTYAGTRAAKAFGLSASQAVWGTAPVYARRCGNISISGLVFRDAPRWTMNICDSSHILIDGVKLVGMWRYNADGIDICACSHTVLRNAFIRSYDDCVIARPQLGADETTPLKDMVVSNCVLWCDWGYNMKVQHGQRACRMGDIRFRDIACVFVQNGALTVTTRWGSDNSVIENVSFDDIRLDFSSDMLMELHQVADDKPFVPRRMDRLLMANIGAYSMGRPAPNQGKPGKMDPNFFKLDYRDISFSRFVVYDAPQHRVTQATNCFVKISRGGVPRFTRRNITFRDMPPGSLCPKDIK